MHDAEHAGDDTTSVVVPEQGGCQDEGAAVDGGVLVVSGREPAPVCEAVECSLDDVAAAVGVAVVGDGRPPRQPRRLRVGLLVVGFGGSRCRSRGLAGVSLVGQNTVGPGARSPERSPDPQAGEQWQHHRSIAGPARGEPDDQRAATAVDRRVDLRAQVSSWKPVISQAAVAISSRRPARGASACRG